MSYTVTTEFQFEAAHFLPGHPTCGNVHGHNWRVEVTIGATCLDEQGFVVDFSELKQAFGRIKVLLDHRLLVQEGSLDQLVEPSFPIRTTTFPFSPTCENLARWIYHELINRCIPSVDDQTEARLFLDHVTVWETDQHRASYMG